MIGEALDCCRAVVAGASTPNFILTAREEAIEWFASTSSDVLSFLWVCVQLNLDPEPIRKEAFRRALDMTVLMNPVKKLGMSLFEYAAQRGFLTNGSDCFM
jgi:hypothetical protein